MSFLLRPSYFVTIVIIAASVAVLDTTFLFLFPYLISSLPLQAKNNHALCHDTVFPDNAMTWNVQITGMPTGSEEHVRGHEEGTGRQGWSKGQTYEVRGGQVEPRG